MKIAVVGCAHGELEYIYEKIADIEQNENVKIDLLLCCGDFQATRNLHDLECMARPIHHRSMCSFYKYYSGEKAAPVLTIFIGGNHEASNYLQELPFGGWVAPLIYYLGYAGVVQYKGIRIAGVSGIFKGYHFHVGRFERTPYSEETIRSTYHYREQEFFRMLQVSEPIDIMMSHDWPKNVEKFGKIDQLVEEKPHFRDQITRDQFGSPPCYKLLKYLKPSHWFAAHMHVEFSAIIPHENRKNTKFLALSKCVHENEPKHFTPRKFLDVIDFNTDTESESNSSNQLQYDLEWLAILYATNHLTDIDHTKKWIVDGNATANSFRQTVEQKAAILQRFNNNLNIPNNFVRTAPMYDQKDGLARVQKPNAVENPQTVQFCRLLGVDDPLQLIAKREGIELSRFDEQLNQELGIYKVDLIEKRSDCIANVDISPDVGELEALQRKMSLS